MRVVGGWSGSTGVVFSSCLFSDREDHKNVSDKYMVEKLVQSQEFWLF